MDDLHTGAGAPAEAGAYRVLARKYRPWSFDDLIGQEPMVRTLTNSFSTGRIAQAWILTGVRGVGKTTTARILARALNYDRGDGTGGPSILMPEPGIHCAAIMESQHIDVLEMDAASRTGIDDVREIIDGVQYSPANARYKVYIIDEVHMLSEKAFNAFLKTLEEPPPYVKFVFATTEIRKVPVTVLSRCQRFNLRRVESEVLVRHLAGIAEKERVEVEPEALAVIARAAEGSVRDSLSLLDQAIAHGAARVTAEEVRAMLGLTDRVRIVDLFEHVMRGDAATALAEMKAQFDEGADPQIVLTDLAEFVHLVTRIKLAPKAADDPAVTEVERDRGRGFAEKLSMRVLSRAWQMLLKGIAEVQEAQKPEQAADMVIVRLAYASDLPTPDEALKALAGQPPGISPARALPSAEPRQPAPVTSISRDTAPRAEQPARPAPAAEPAPAFEPPASQAAAPSRQKLDRLEDLVALAIEKRDIRMKFALERQVRPTLFQDGRLEFVPTADAPPELAGTIARRLADWTGERWVVAVSSGEGEPTLAERAAEEDAERKRGIAGHPEVQRVLERFPGAKIVDVRILKEEPAIADDVPLDAAEGL